MQIFEKIPCSLCNSSDSERIYSSTQYADDFLAKMRIDLVLCKNCSFVYQNPQLTSAALRKHYLNSSSATVFSLNSDNSRYNILINERKDFIKNVIEMNNIKKICDVGGGKGILISSLDLPEDIQKFLIEPSDAIYECEDEKVVKIKDFVEEYIRKKEQKFDLVMCISALEHLKDPSLVLDSFNELLDDKGFLLLEVPNSLTPYNTFAEFYSYEHINHFSIRTLSLFLHKSGFYPVKIEQSKRVPNIRILAKKYEKEILLKEVKDVFLNYNMQKEGLSEKIIQKVITPIKSVNIKSLGIYGAGEHTKFILEKVDILEYVDCFIDSNKSKHGKYFYGKKIIAPRDIEKEGLSHIMISSHDFEDEMYNTIKENSNNIEIITLYRGE